MPFFVKNFHVMAVIILAGFVFAPSALAAEGKVVECGMPVTGDIDTDPAVDFCDIYTRQLDFAADRKKFSEQLRERQKNFAAPSIEAGRTYNKNMDIRNGFTKKSDDDEASEAMAENKADTTEDKTSKKP
jgi:hypothetical protein